MTLRAGLLAMLAIWWGHSAAEAFTPQLPASTEALASVTDAPDRHDIAVSKTAYGTPSEVISLDAARVRQSWRIPAADTTKPEIIDNLRTQLIADGFEIVFDCVTDACGGYDFRISRDIFPLPDMFVDLGGFQYLAASSSNDDDIETLYEAIVSSTGEWVYLQTSQIATADPALQDTDVPLAETEAPRILPQAATNADPTSIAGALLTDGHVALEGLEFASGTAELTSEPAPVLEALAAYLLEDNARRIALVGHSDWQGSRDANRRLALARAQRIQTELAREHGVPAGQMTAHGIGDLAPRSSNLTEEGRLSNRRVDVVAQPDAPK